MRDIRRKTKSNALLEAESDDPLALSSGAYFYHQSLREPNPIARDQGIQDGLIEACSRLSGVPLPS
jgi:hypothetical protein